jgi:tryptophan synthase alpha chain
MTEQSSGRRSALDVVLSRNAPVLVCYLPIGDPLVGDYIVKAYTDAGVNIVEMGMPTQHPRLDGPDIAGSMLRAMRSGTDVLGTFREVGRRLRQGAPQIGTVCMTYADSPILAQSTRETFESVDATLILGVAGEESAAGQAAAGIPQVVFVPARFTDRDIEAARKGGTYVMLQASDGMTGPRADLDPANEDRIRRLRSGGVRQRILLGFGISTADQARAALDMGADGVIIGSMCMRKALEGEPSIRAFLHEVRAAIDA